MQLSTLALLLTAVSAHPGESHGLSEDIKASRINFVNYVKREGGSCNSLGRRDVDIAETHRNRIAQLRREIAEAKLGKRDVAEDIYRFATIDHESDRKNITADISLDDLFTADDATCLLQQEQTEGPYFITGEFIREDLTDGQQGVPLYMGIQLFDVHTCEPVPDIYLEVWACNAEGIYSGVQAASNGGNGDYYNETWGRGIQPTGENGAASFKTIFPGHYVGRAVHMHITAHADVTVYDNNTIGSGKSDSGRVTHVGQLFFDQDLITEVEKTSPYNTNQQPLQLNLDDNILALEETADSPDPFFKYVKLTDDISDGIYAWAAVGIETTGDYTIYPAAYYDAQGGHGTGQTYTPPENIRGPGPRSRSSHYQTTAAGSAGNTTAAASDVAEQPATATSGTVVASGAADNVKPMAMSLAILGLGSLAAMYM